MADSERATPISYKWSIVTFCVSQAVFELIRCFVYNGISLSRPKIWGFFAPPSPKFENSSARPRKALPYVKTRVLMYWSSAYVNRCDLWACRKNKTRKKKGNFFGVNVTPPDGYLSLVGFLPNVVHVVICLM